MNQAVFGSTGFIDVKTLSSTGTYTIVVDPVATGTGSVTLTLYNVPADCTGTITPGGSSVTVTTTAPGQNGSLTFSGTSNQRISLQAAGGTFSLGNYSILNPDGSALVNQVSMGATGFIDVKTLSSTGTYAIVVDPVGAGTGSVTLTLYNVPADFSGSITPGGSSVAVTTTVPGQNGTLTFTGTAGQRISLQAAGGTFAAGEYVSIFKPDGSALVNQASMGATGYLEVMTLPATGTYTILIDPFGTSTGGLTLTLNSVPADFSGTITPGGSSVTVTTTVPGQNAALTFSGTSGQRISLQAASGTFAIGEYVSILKPDSTALVSPVYMLGTGFIDVQTLPSTGTYTIFVDPYSTSTGSLTLTLNNVPTDFSGTITPGGSSVTMTTTVPGQNGAVTFSGTSGQRISLQETGGTFAGGEYLSILNPNGTALVSPVYTLSTGFIDVVTLSSTGTYTIVVDPYTTSTGSITLTLYSVPSDPTTTLTIGGSSATLTTTTPGQNALATFSGTSAQQVTVHLTSNSIGTTTVSLLKPDGSQLTSTQQFSSSFNLSQQTLPTTGTYSIKIDPFTSLTGSITVNVTTP